MALPRRLAGALATLAAALPLAALVASADGCAADTSLRDRWPAEQLQTLAAMHLDRAGVRPPDPSNAVEGSEAAAALGQALFHDRRLSRDGRVACASCHDPAHGYSVPEKVGHGIGGTAGRRNPPSLYALQGRTHLDWDGGGGTLAARVLAPLADPREMGTDVNAALARLAGTDLADDFARLFPGEGLSARTASRTLVAYLSTLDDATLDGETRFDRFARGDSAALDDTELTGLHLFRTKARCANCHFGPWLSDGRFHNLRLSFFGEPAQDLGRYEATGRAEDAGRFRTASLRHVSLSAPYMHNGLFPTLAGVVNLYDRGGGEVWARNAAEAARPLHGEAARLSPHIRPLGLTEAEKAALVAFLKAL